MIGSDSKKGSNTFHSNLNYLPNLSFSKNIKCMKHECILPYDFERVFLSCLPSFNATETIPNVTRVQVLENYTSDEIIKIYHEKNKSEKMKNFPSDQLYSTVDLYFGFPLNPRKISNTNKCYYDKNTKSLIIINKPFLMEGMEFSKPSMMEILLPNEKSPTMTKAYPFFDWIFQCYQKMDERKVLFTQVFYSLLNSF
jgi:hypothetical protein